jgi:hypothetical protein
MLKLSGDFSQTRDTYSDRRMPKDRNPLLDKEPSEGFTDPHVVYLLYDLMPDDRHVAIRQRQPIEFETDDFKVRVASDGGEIPEMGGIMRASVRRDDAPDRPDGSDDQATEAAVLLKTHYATIAAARAAVEPILDAWALDAILNHGFPRFQFFYTGSKMADLRPPYGATYVVGRGFLVVEPNRTHVDSLPPPPTTFAADTHTATLWNRWNRYLDKKAELPAVAYAVLTYLETELAAGRADAAARLSISTAVLTTLGRLASNVGDAETARKFGRGAARRPYTPAETAWLEAVVPEIIRRVGVLAADGQPASLTMADLPPLGS